MSNKTIAICAPFVDRMLSVDKFPYLGACLQADGYDPVFLCHDEHSGPLYHKQKLPYLNLTFTKQPVDILPAMEQYVKLVNRPLFAESKVPAPTLGELIGYDDFLGCAQGYKIGGAESLRPDCLVTCIPGAESQSPEDSLMSLALYRFCLDNGIPRIGLEGSPLDNDCKLIQWPVDLLLTKKDPRGNERIRDIAPQALRQALPLRYVLSIDQSPVLDEFIKDGERRLREKLGPPGARFLYLPFHLSFKSYCVQLLERIAPYAKELLEANFKLIVSVQHDSWRRNLKEREMVAVGMRRWLDNFPGWAVVEGVPHTFMSLIADAVLAPYESPLTEQCEKWGVDVIRLGQEERLTNLACGISLSQAVAWALQETEKKEAA